MAVFIHKKMYTRSHTTSATMSAKYHTLKYTYIDLVSIAKASELIALH
jgi:hypothetical protein